MVKGNIWIFLLLVAVIIMLAMAISCVQPPTDTKPVPILWEMREEKNNINRYSVWLRRHLPTGRCFLSLREYSDVTIETAPEVCAVQGEKP